MDIFNLLNSGLQSLKANPLRSVLTVLSVVIGIAAVISVVAFGEGHKQRIQQEIAKIGADVFWIVPDTPKIIKSSDDEQNQRHRFNYLTNSDLNALKKNMTKVQKIAAYNNFYISTIINNKEVYLNSIATEPSYLSIGRLRVVSGRFLSDVDLRMSRKVCVLEYTDRLKKTLASCNPLDNYIYINNMKFKIIGLARKEIEFIGNSYETNLFIPISTMKYFNQFEYINRIYCQTEQAMLKDAMKQAESILKSRNQGDMLFEAINARRMFQSAERLTKTASLVTAGIAMISLLVGGIGIMNIMLVSVTERTNEIGLRKAVGAKISDIRNQFLFESILLTLCGGLFGIFAGIFIAKLISSILQIPVDFSVWAIGTGIIFSILIGVLSGFYPAFKASKLNPIETLNYE